MTENPTEARPLTGVCRVPIFCSLVASRQPGVLLCTYPLGSSTPACGRRPRTRWRSWCCQACAGWQHPARKVASGAGAGVEGQGILSVGERGRAILELASLNAQPLWPAILTAALIRRQRAASAPLSLAAGSAAVTGLPGPSLA